MIRNILYVAFLLLLVGFYGCETSPTGTEYSTDIEAIKALMIDNPGGYFSYIDHYGEEDTKTINENKAESYTIWWREPTNVDMIIGVDIVNDSAHVKFSPEIKGIFHIFEYDTLLPDTIMHYMKNMMDNVIHYAVFKHYPDSIGYRGWRLDKITGVEITSYPNTVNIDSVLIECESYPNTLIINPLVFFQWNNILSFSPGEEVFITVYTDDDIYAFLHARGHRNGYTGWWRWELSNAGEGIFSGSWVVPQVPRVRMFALDILNKNTIDNPEYQYDSNVWVFPYIIEIE